MIKETEFKVIVEETLGRYMSQRGTFGVSLVGSGVTVLHFDHCGWSLSVDSTGVWTFGTGRGFHGEGRSLSEAIQNEEERAI